MHAHAGSCTLAAPGPAKLRAGLAPADEAATATKRVLVITDLQGEILSDLRKFRLYIPGHHRKGRCIFSRALSRSTSRLPLKTSGQFNEKHG